MAAKRKQEERHLKLLREMTTLLHNRKCFDCDQRGPTYADMTIGSFVCTSCSGILRGLNPPHRVKSISMTTFTLQEIEFLRTHGNDVCKQIWLGLYDENSSVYPDFRDPQKVKVFLQEKYEKKRWFVPAERAWAVAAAHASISGSSASSASSTPEIKPGKSQTSDTTPALPLNKGTPTQSPAASRSQGSQQEKKVAPFDLLADLGGDIFATPQSAPPYFANFAHFNSHTASNSMNTDFANFDAFESCNASDSFGSFSSASLPSFQSNSSGSGSSASTNAHFANFDNFPKSSSADFGAFCFSGSDTSVIKAHAVSEDKYAALADLDNVFSSNTQTQVSFGTASMSMPTLFATRAGYSLPTSFSGGFQQPVLSAPGAFSQHSAFPPHPTGGGFSSFGQPKPMLMPYSQQMGVSTNPFLAGAPMGQFPTGNSSTNPFL
ncbi:arf-GAP domain and FG repeat-containing protein 1 isoform X6 [Amblyraja radiata]|uniref:arf-GAP domain and FG repeat-containing protein 1 isoform X6 n=1 Tax=Amblyraja radiata TaxID=386614 RepID=UPI001403B4E6|nr:arf-GAP domain and FG repeat-containing protein 1 isoform X6 [Amblyraja radiata]